MSTCKHASIILQTKIHLSITMQPTTNVKKVEMDFIPYANAIRSLMHLIICIIFDLAFLVGHLA
jgi:hypothetical protein